MEIENFTLDEIEAILKASALDTKLKAVLFVIEHVDNPRASLVDECLKYLTKTSIIDEKREEEIKQ